MASSSKPERMYHVFLSFRGEDVRNNFLGHLYRALDQKGICTYVDNEKLRKGEQIAPALMKAIEESQIAIIIFSEDYASSWWCLEEVARIMDCKKERDLMVFPLFYKVEPREVRTPRERYRQAMIEHESKFGKDSKEVKRWEKALSDAGNLSGWHLKDGDESELIQRIVTEISIHLDQTLLHVATHPVGMDSRVPKLKSMLNLEYDDDVLMVGLWGQGGIGKTALAKAVYNDIFNQFRNSCFLANVREVSKDCKDLVTLQEKLLFEMLALKERLVVSNVDRGINLIQERLRHKKVLLILDDVDDLHQLHALVGEGKWLCNGSRIIVTTRDSHLLTYLGIDQYHVYEVRELDDNEARELFSKHAFPTHQTFKIRTDLVDSVLNHAKGLPLALEVLGSFLRGRREYEWESALDEISTAPKKDINDVLKISYGGLEPKVKEIFLHIACFFKGWYIEHVKKVLNSCDLNTIIGLQILMERSLIRIESQNIQMHDLIQLMGMDIVNQESDDPRRRSRLWLYDDVVDVLSSNMGNRTVRAIVVEPPKLTEIFVDPDAFTKMTRLRLLILRNVQNTFQGPICLPNELRWFEWPGCACRILNFSSGPKKLVGLDMSNCNITVVPNQFKDFRQMKYINLSECELLVSMPDLSCTPNLEELYLQDCKNLVEAHELIACHDKLQVLNLSGCRNFKRFPDIPRKFKSLKSLFLKGTAIKELPASIKNLVSLESMDLCNCKNLISLPSTIYKLQNIQELILQGCTTLIGFPKYEDPADPSMKTGLSSLQYLNLQGCNLSEVEFLENLSSFSVLRRLNLSRNNITGLPTSINKRDHLSLLNVGDCYQLQEIPELPPFLNYFWADNCKSLQKTGDLISSHEIARMIQKFTIDCYSFICLPGGEIPEWFVPIEEGLVSFRASKDLYDKFLGLAFCVVLSNNEQKEQQSCFIKPSVNGQRRRDIEWMLNSFDSDHLWLQFHTPYSLFRAIDFGPIDGSYKQFGLEVSCEKLKKWGFRIICKQLEDNLKVLLRDNQLMDPALLYEIGHDSTDSEIESSRMHEDTSRDIDCHAEEHNQIGSKRNHDFILPQGKRVKTVLTSNSTDGEENGEEAIRRQTSNSTNAAFSITTAHLPSDTSEAPTNVRSPPANGGNEQ